MVKKIHFIGIGGISLSGLAKFCSSRGMITTGSDLQKSIITKELEKNGVKVFYKHSWKNVKDADIVVYTDAIDPKNAEFVYAKQTNKMLYSRAKFLNFVASLFKKTVAVAGCHGKTTTTALTHYAFASLKPTSHIGGVVNGNNFFIGKDNYFITEACEYKKNLLNLSPDYAIILNIDKDHMDCYKNLREIKSTFQKFANNINKNGILFINGDDKNCKSIIHKNKITFGLKQTNDFYALNIKDGISTLSFDVYYKGNLLKHVNLNCGLKHNVYNALATIALCETLKIKNYFQNIQKFKGVDRRNQFIKSLNGVQIFHDYAHHPKEINKIISEHKNFCLGRLFVVFEAHTYSRTKSLICEFKTCFQKADELFVLPIYPAREKQIPGINGKYLAQNVNGIYVKSYKQFIHKIIAKVKFEDEILILGAGNIYKLADMF